MKERLEAAMSMEGQPIGWGTMAHDHDIFMLLVETAADEEDLVTLKKFTPLLEKLAVRDSHRLYTGVARRAWGIIHRVEGKKTESENNLQEALTIFENLSAHWQIGKTQFQMGILARQSPDKKAASKHFANALKEFELLKASSNIERTQRELDALKTKAAIAAT